MLQMAPTVMSDRATKRVEWAIARLPTPIIPKRNGSSWARTAVAAAVAAAPYRKRRRTIVVLLIQVSLASTKRHPLKAVLSVPCR